jgi:hypothetical protein
LAASAFVLSIVFLAALRLSSAADRDPSASSSQYSGPATTGSAQSDVYWSGRQTNVGAWRTTTIYDSRDVSGILGSEVRSAADENMGHIVDVVVDGSGQTRAVVIDFGGFLGVGSRKIAVDWNALRFSPQKKNDRIVIELTRAQVKAAPEYQEGKPVVVLGALPDSDPIRLSTTATPEK